LRRRPQSRLAYELWAEIGQAETIEDINTAAGIVLERVQRRARRRAGTAVMLLSTLVYVLMDAAVVEDHVGLQLEFLHGLF
jgi:hypothetical protein